MCLNLGGRITAVKILNFKNYLQGRMTKSITIVSFSIKNQMFNLILWRNSILSVNAFIADSFTISLF